MYIPWTTFLRLLIYFNENEKSQWCLIYFVCKYSEEDCSSRDKLTDVIKDVAVCRITRLASFHPWELTLLSLTREVWTTEDASQKFAYLVLRNTRRPNIKSPDCLSNLLGSLDRDGNAYSNRSGGKSLLDMLFQVISVKKRLMFHRTNRCLRCVGYVYVGRIYQNRDETLVG